VNLYLKIKDTWIEEQYICYFNLGNIYKSLKYDFKLIEKMYLSAIELINDSAEAYYHLGILYNQTNNQEYSYKFLLKAKDIKFEDSAKKYILFLDSRCYGKYILDELSVACYWTNKIQEGIEYLSQIIDDPDLDQNRLQDNMKHLTGKLNVFTI
jgi:tetratricopeptide (TPR) repeat protein